MLHELLIDFSGSQQKPEDGAERDDGEKRRRIKEETNC